MITKRYSPALLFWVLLLAAPLLRAQTVEVKVSAPKVVAVNEPFQLVYTLGQRPGGFQQPDFTDFLFSGPSMASQSSTSIVNGKVSQENRFTYTYVLQGQKEGKFTIGPAKFVVDGKSYSSDPVSIEVVKAKSPAAARSANNNKADGVGEDDLFVRLILDKQSVYAGEPIVASLKIYTRVGIAGFQDIKFPSFTGFWTQDLESPKRLDMSRENVDGIIYEVGLMRKSLLLPNGPGKLTIDPAEMDVVVNYRVAPSSFWDDGYRQMTKKLKTAPVSVQVKALPEPKPQGFSGAVGSFRMKASIDKPQLKTNDAATISVEVSGTGNLNLVKAPEIKMPSDFEVFDTKENANVKVTATGTTGSKTFTYVVIPRHHGAFTIPSIAFSFFDSGDKTYKTLTSDPMSVEVEKGENEETVVSSLNVAREGSEVKVIQNDIRFINTIDTQLQAKGYTLFASRWHVLFFVVLTVLFGSLVAFKRKQIRQNKDLAAMRNRRAGKVSQQRLKVARQHMDKGARSEFFDEVLRALWGYLGDKLTIDQAELNKERVAQALAGRQIDAPVVERLLKLMDACEFARYAPVQNSEIGSTYDEATALINTLEQKL